MLISIGFISSPLFGFTMVIFLLFSKNDLVISLFFICRGIFYRKLWVKNMEKN